MSMLSEVTVGLIASSVMSVAVLLFRAQLTRAAKC